MNSGKSTAVLQVAHNYEERGMHVLIVKASIDTKANDQIASRLGMSRKVDILASESDDLFKRINSANPKPDCVLVDESQFLSTAQIDQLQKVVIDLNIPVICYGIRTDFQTNLFPGSKRLMELGNSLEELKTICRCGKKALFNGRKINGKFVFEGTQVAIDGLDAVDYESLCEKCYQTELKQFLQKS